MDCVIPGHNIKIFSCAIGCLSRIGKELYVEFDPLQGLTVRTLNDAKSAFSSFSFEPPFFERCSAPADAVSSARDGRKRRRVNDGAAAAGGRDENDDDDEDEQRRFVCRVPIKTVHAVLRPRKGVTSLRVRSDDGGHDHRSTSRSDDQPSSRRSASASASSSCVTPLSSQEDEDYEDDDDGYVGGRARRRGRARRPRLSFEFLVRPARGVLRVTRRVGVADARSVTAVAPRRGCSEMLSAPGVLTKLLAPLKRTSEVALRVDGSTVSAASFHPGDGIAAKTSVDATSGVDRRFATRLNTETTVGRDELDGCDLRDDRDVSRGDVPPNVNEEVTLVFGIKEVRAMLQFCSQANGGGDSGVVAVYFEWGGRPIIFETDPSRTNGESYSGELVLATLDYKLLTGYNLGGGGGSSGGRRGGSVGGGAGRRQSGDGGGDSSRSGGGERGGGDGDGGDNDGDGGDNDGDGTANSSNEN